MCFISDDYDDIATIYKKSVHKSRKERKCYDCRRVIGIGDQYLYWPQFLLDGRDGARQRVTVGHVGDDGEGSRGSLAAASRHRDAVTQFHKFFGDGITDSTVTPGDKNCANCRHKDQRSGGRTLETCRP